MGFRLFLEQFDALQEEIEQLLAEADTLQWDPNVGKEHIGTGINRDTGVAQQNQQPKIAAPTTRPKRGDVVFMAQGNMMIPSLVVQTDNVNAMLMNKQRNFKAIRPLASLRQAPSNLMTKYPGHAGWIVVTGAADTLQ